MPLRIGVFGRASEREAERRTAIEEKGQAKATATTLRCYARAYHEKHVEPLRTFKHGQQWINSIEQHVPGALLDTTLDLISPLELLDAAVPILRDVPETGSRICQRLATVFESGERNNSFMTMALRHEDVVVARSDAMRCDEGSMSKVQLDRRVPFSAHLMSAASTRM